MSAARRFRKVASASAAIAGGVAESSATIAKKGRKASKASKAAEAFKNLKLKRAAKADALAKKADELGDLGKKADVGDLAKKADDVGDLGKKADDVGDLAKKADDVADIVPDGKKMAALKKYGGKGADTIANNKKNLAAAVALGLTGDAYLKALDNLKKQEEDIKECKDVCFPINWIDYVADPENVTIEYNTLAMAKENDDDPPGDKSWEETLFCKDPTTECNPVCITGCKELHKRDILTGPIGDFTNLAEEGIDRVAKKAMDKVKEAGEGLLEGLGIDPGMFKYIMWGIIALVIFMVIKMFI